MQREGTDGKKSLSVSSTVPTLQNQEKLCRETRKNILDGKTIVGTEKEISQAQKTGDKIRPDFQIEELEGATGTKHHAK